MFALSFQGDLCDCMMDNLVGDCPSDQCGQGPYKKRCKYCCDQDPVNQTCVWKIGISKITMCTTLCIKLTSETDTAYYIVTPLDYNGSTFVILYLFS